MDKHIKEIQEKLCNAQKQVEKYKNAFEALQDICEHDWRYDGHGHNSDFYSCRKCGSVKED
jgi:mRNA-degrading endonuclease YafQ of YafQ-DinJ toxin-antitoxin module